MIIIADSPRPHKRILQKGEWRDGGEGVGAQPPVAPPPGAAPRSLPLLHTLPGGRLAGPALSRKPAKKAGQGRGSLSRRGSPAESPGIGPQARRRLRRRRGGLRPALSRTIPISPHNPTPNCHHVLHTSPAQTSPRYHQILPNPPPSPGKIPPRPRKKAPPPSGRRFAHIFGFSPAWQGRHGCGRGSPHGPAPPPALCRRRG